MFARSMLTLLALASVAGCHRRTFEPREREDTTIATSTEITQAVYPRELQQTQAPPPTTAAPAAPTATATEAVTQRPAEPPGSDRYSIVEAPNLERNLGLGDAGARA
jgi:hypothetical protein